MQSIQKLCCWCFWPTLNPMRKQCQFSHNEIQTEEKVTGVDTVGIFAKFSAKVPSRGLAAGHVVYTAATCEAAIFQGTRLPTPCSF